MLNQGLLRWYKQSNHINNMPIEGKIQDRVSFWRKEPSEFLLNVHESALLFCGVSFATKQRAGNDIEDSGKSSTGLRCLLCLQQMKTHAFQSRRRSRPGEKGRPAKPRALQLPLLTTSPCAEDLWHVCPCSTPRRKNKVEFLFMDI